MSESVSNSYYLLEDATFQMRNMLDELEFDPERLNYIEMRLNEIKQLKRKYGATVEDILEYASKIEEEIDQIENRDSHLQSLKRSLTPSAKMSQWKRQMCHKSEKHGRKSWLMRFIGN